MSKTTLSVLFKKQQRDDKKEILKFEYKGSDDSKPIPDSLFLLAGELVIIEFPNTDIGPISAEFAKVNKDSKKTTMDFNLKGDSEAKALKTYEHAGHNVTLSIEPSQQDLTEQLQQSKEDKEDLEYTNDLTGTPNGSKLEEKQEESKQTTEKEDPEELDLEKEEVDIEDDNLPF